MIKILSVGCFISRAFTWVKFTIVRLIYFSFICKNATALNLISYQTINSLLLIISRLYTSKLLSALVAVPVIWSKSEKQKSEFTPFRRNTG